MKEYLFTELRVRTKMHPEELERRKGKIVTDDALDWMVVGPTVIRKADGSLLAVYLPGALDAALLDDTHAALYDASKGSSDNRGMASGYPRRKTKLNSTRSRTPPVASSIIGSFDPGGAYRYCRLTAWSGRELEKWSALFPLFRSIDAYFKRYVPDRYAAQEGFAERTHPDWRIAGTVFTTITVNRSYPTGVHTDAGDLDEGFSTLAVLRKGAYEGGIFTFVEYRGGVDMRHGDLLLMDAHEWHGNTFMTCRVCGEGMGSLEFYPSHEECGSERISVVSYYRTKMTTCGSREEEEQKALDAADRKVLSEYERVKAMQEQAIREMAAESMG